MRSPASEPPRVITAPPRAVQIASVLIAAGLGLFWAFQRQVDFEVYRMGGKDLFGQHLYTASLPHYHLPFTYPPFAALLFGPFALIPVRVGQVLWALLSVAALFGLIGASIRAVRPEWPTPQVLSVASAATLPMFLLRPVISTFSYGQVNLLIALMVLVDLTGLAGALRLGSHRLPGGVLVGIAAAVKLTPLAFIPFLFLTRQARAGYTASASFVVCTLGTLAIAPHSSWLYWTEEIFKPGRSGNLLYISNQNLRSLLERLTHAHAQSTLLAVLSVLVAGGGLALAAWAYRQSSPMLGIVLCAATGLLVSPVSWTHHYVWIVPVVVWLLLGRDAPTRGHLWAMAAALLFWGSPNWWVPDPQSGYGPVLVFLRANSLFLATATFLVLAAVMLHARRLRGTERQVPAALGFSGEGTGGGREGVRGRAP